MAQTKKSNTRTTAGRSPKKAAAKSGTRSTAQKKAPVGRPKGSGQKKNVKSMDPGIRREVIFIAGVLAAVLLFLGNLGLAGSFGDRIAAVQFGICGLLAYAFPVYLFVIACFTAVNGSHYPVNTAVRIMTSILTLSVICALMELFGGHSMDGVYSLSEYYRTGADGMRGGWLGGIWMRMLYPSMGPIGTGIVLIALAVAGFVITTGKRVLLPLKKRGEGVVNVVREESSRIHDGQEIRRREKAIQREEAKEERAARLEYLRQEQENRLDRKVGGVVSGDEIIVGGGLKPITGLKGKPVSDSRMPGFLKNFSKKSEPQSTETEPEVKKEESVPIRIRRNDILPAQSEENINPAVNRSEQTAAPEKAAPSYTKNIKKENRSMAELAQLDQRAGTQSAKVAARKDNYDLKEDFLKDVCQVQRIDSEFARGQGDIPPFDWGFEPGDKDNTLFEENGKLSQPIFEPDHRETAAGEKSPDDLCFNDLVAPEEDEEESIDLRAETDLSDLPEIKASSEQKKEEDDWFAEPDFGHEKPAAAEKVPEPEDRMWRTGGERDGSSGAVFTGKAKTINNKEEIVPVIPAPLPVKKKYRFPTLGMLARGQRTGRVKDEELRNTAAILQQTLQNFGVNVTVTDISCGPSVTRYELHPEQGVKVSRIVALADDIKLNLAATDIRIEAPIPGKAAVGIEVPNPENQTVYLRELLESEEFRRFPSKLAFAVGQDIGGKVIVADLAKMPHLLIAGATGSGKSVCINTLIMSILYKAKPEEVRMIMIDPKVVELSAYNGIPHLLIPVVTDPKKAAGALNWAVAEMTRRYKQFADACVRDIKGYNKKMEESEDAEAELMPQIVIIVDELADLMMVAPGEVEESICRLAQLARAAGIHLVLATQRPSVNVITGLIKANVPSRIAFAVSSGVDSRTIIDMNGAEKLLGKGDMLFYPTGYPKPVRVQGAFVSDNEVAEITDFLREQTDGASNLEELEKHLNGNTDEVGRNSGSSQRDELFAKAGQLIIDKDKASIGNLQRAFRIGFNRAARIMDQLSEAGVVGPEEGTKPRQVLMSEAEFEAWMEENL